MNIDFILNIFLAFKTEKKLNAIERLTMTSFYTLLALQNRGEEIVPIQM